MSSARRPSRIVALLLVTGAVAAFVIAGLILSGNQTSAHPGGGTTGLDVGAGAGTVGGASVSVDIVLHEIPAPGFNSYNFDVTIPAGLGFNAGSSTTCHTGTIGFPPALVGTSYTGFCANAGAAAAHPEASPGPLVLATLVVDCLTEGTHSLDLDATSAYYSTVALPTVPVLVANAGDGSVDCTVPPTPTLTPSLTPTPTLTETPTQTLTPTPTFTPTPAPDPDVLVEKLADPNPSPNEGVVDMTIRVRNNGLGPATGVLVADLFPPGTTLLSAPDPLCVSVTGGIACGFFNLAANDLAPGGPDELEFHMFLQMPDVVVDTVVTNTAQAIAGNEPPENQTNNAGSVDVLVEAPPPPDLVISKSATPEPAEALGDVTYTLHVRNIGPGTAAAVMISDPVPAGTTFLAGGSSAECSLSVGVISCTGGNLAADDLLPGGPDEVMRTVQLKMPNGHVNQNVTNNVSVSTIDEPPANIGNNTGSHTILVIGCPDINNDGVVNSFDLMILVLAYQTMPPDPLFNAAADINQDGKINSFDLLVLVFYYTQPCTPLP